MAPTHKLTGWGGTSATTAEVVPGKQEDVAQLVNQLGPRGLVARGLARSYGDAAQNGGGTVVDMTGTSRILAVDTTTGVIEVEAGLSLDTLMRRLLPLGLFTPVSPGTRMVTVGGAIAADIHGKNHHVDGSFGQHVLSLDLLVADGSVHSVTPDDPLFWATVGGMGLTGVILRATVRMKQVKSSYCVVDTERTRDLDDLLERMATNDHRYTYSVAWIDCLARGSRMGRSVLTRGSAATVDQLPNRLRRKPLSFDPPQLLSAPPVFPSGLLNKWTVAAFNEAWYRKAPRERRGQIQGIAPFFHPLDGVAHWNRIYGPRGFLQYQFVIPLDQEEPLLRCVDLLSSSGQASFLAVLKRFGAANAAPLSFPFPGWTLALDIPIGSPDLSRLLRQLDEVVLTAGGRLYLAKDSRMPAELVPLMYSRLDEWQQIRRAVDPDGVFTSDLARRLDL